MSAPPPPVALGHAAVAVRPFRARGRTQLAVIVKAVFQIVPGRAMTPLRPVPLIASDIPASADPRAPIAAASELAPYLTNTDVLLTGHACARGRVPAPVVPVRLCVRLDQKILLDKTLHVYGDRGPGGRGAPQPFASMPLGYERALGGAADPDNPAGVDPRTGAAPSIVDPNAPRRAAGFGPLAAHWPARMRRLKNADPRPIQAPWPTLPDGFDWAYYQAAPPDQQPPYLEGREALLLEGLHPDVPRVQAVLPGPVAEAQLALPGARRPQSLPLVADMLIIDANRWVCSLVWRASSPLPHDNAIVAARVTAKVTLPGEEIPWDDAPAAPPPAAKASVPPPAAHSAVQASPAQAPSGQAPPAQAPSGQAPPAQPSSAQASSAQAPPAQARADHPLDRTAALSPAEMLAKGVLPFQGPAVSVRQARPAPRGATLEMPAFPDMTPAEARKAALPFAPSAPGAPTHGNAPPPETLDDDDGAAVAAALPFAPATNPVSRPAPVSGLPFSSPAASPAAIAQSPWASGPPSAATPPPPAAAPPAAIAQSPWASGPPSTAAPPAVAPQPVAPSYAAAAPPAMPSYAIAARPVSPVIAAEPSPVAAAAPAPAAPRGRAARPPRRRFLPGEKPPSAEPLIPPRKRRPSKVAADGLGASFLKSAKVPLQPAPGAPGA